VTIGNRRILLTHIFRPELLEQEADVIVFGHSHRPHNEVIEIEGKRVYHIDLAR
jgi:predicted phosphodiesterase